MIDDFHYSTLEVVFTKYIYVNFEKAKKYNKKHSIIQSMTYILQS